jgi:hypothetical protein
MSSVPAHGRHSPVRRAIDGFDLLILGFLLRVLSADLKLSPAQGAALVTATLIGAVIGGIVFGVIKTNGEGSVSNQKAVTTLRAC